VSLITAEVENFKRLIAEADEKYLATVSQHAIEIEKLQVTS
jgi:hypothetical protein